MKNKKIWLAIGLLITLSMLLASCASGETSSTSASTAATTKTSTATSPSGTSTAATTTSASANWWDKFGEPEYGGTITIQTNSLQTSFDTWFWTTYFLYSNEMLFMHDWTVDRDVFPFALFFTPDKYWVGALAESYEIKDPQTIIIHLRQGVYWHDKAPTNGREFNADDVVYHYDRLLGTGSGFTEKNGALGGWTAAYDRVTKIDNYTVQFKFTGTSAVVNFWSLLEGNTQLFEAKEWIDMTDEQKKDWKNATGTGPFILTDYAQNTSATMSRNENYWGYDERYPENKLPYVDEVKIIQIPDPSTSLAALRTGKIDKYDLTTYAASQTLAKSNPEILQTSVPAMNYNFYIRTDNKPFDDIRVRKALNMAINRDEMAQALWGGLVDGQPVGIMSPLFEGYCYPYAEWSADLKEGYGYNPDKAKALLAEAGYPNGFATNVVASTDTDSQYLQAIKSYFNDIGVEMSISQMDMQAYSAYLTEFKFDALAAWTSKAGHYPRIALQTFWSQNRMNRSKVNDPAYDQLVADFNAAQTVDAVQKIAQEADKYYLDNYWELNSFPIAKFIAYQPYLKGYTSGALDYMPMYYWSRSWIDSKMKQSMGH